MICFGCGRSDWELAQMYCTAIVITEKSRREVTIEEELYRCRFCMHTAASAPQMEKISAKWIAMSELFDALDGLPDRYELPLNKFL